jgi:DNA-directed RNA polymerase subunit RPC12/RpoP
MIQCANCGKELTNTPQWLAGVKTTFVCNNCPKRNIKNITQLNIEDIIGPEAVAKKEDE